jgi:hypothetical protein
VQKEREGGSSFEQCCSALFFLSRLFCFVLCNFTRFKKDFDCISFRVVLNNRLVYKHKERQGVCFKRTLLQFDIVSAHVRSRCCCSLSRHTVAIHTVFSPSTSAAICRVHVMASIRKRVSFDENYSQRQLKLVLTKRQHTKSSCAKHRQG